MKKILLAIIALILTLSAQSECGADATLCDSLYAEEQQVIGEPFRIERSMRSDLPSRVDNSESSWFRPIFNQLGNSCTIASNIGYIFTYEYNRLWGKSADTPENWIAYGFIFNFMNSGKDSFIRRLEGLDLTQEVGCATWSDFEQTGSYSHWMSGYDKYYNALKTKVKEYRHIEGRSTETVEAMKQYLFNRGESGGEGGLIAAGGYMGTGVQINVLPEESYDAGKKIITKFANKRGGHAMTWVGYDDSVKYDINGDGLFTNDIDITGDGVVDLKDWEIGAFILANSYGPNWANDGKAYVMYRLAAFSEGSDGGMSGWKDIITLEKYEPRLMAKLNITHTCRNDLKFFLGISENITDDSAEKWIDFDAFSYKGGAHFMQGDTNESDKTIELGLDASSLLDSISGNDFKLFLKIESKMNGEGRVNSFSIIDYQNNNSSPQELVSSGTDIPIESVAMLSITKSTTTALRESYQKGVNPLLISNTLSGNTTLQYELRKPEKITIDIIDTKGRIIETVRNEYQQAGTYQIRWSGSDKLARGLYFCRLTIGKSTYPAKFLVE